MPIAILLSTYPLALTKDTNLSINFDELRLEAKLIRRIPKKTGRDSKPDNAVFVYFHRCRHELGTGVLQNGRLDLQQSHAETLAQHGMGGIIFALCA